jgi:hypothetical protein
MQDQITNPGLIQADDAPVAPFPEGSRILHIGPPKTGTTALQVACWRARASLLEQGVRYAGGQKHAAAPARAVTGHKTITGNTREVPSIRWWNALVREIDGAREPRVLYSSEALAEAGDDAIRRIATDVGTGIEILITLRPIDAVLASQWQQLIQNGSELSIDAWLHRVLGEGERAPGDPGPLRVFRQGDLVERWASVVGADHVTVVVVDRADPGFLFRTSEALLGLRPGTLQTYDDQSNRSLSLPEVEVIRHMNRQAREAGVPNGPRSALVTAGAAATVKRRPMTAGAPRIRLPAWAAAQAIEMGESAQAQIRASGVRVLGDPVTLIPEPPRSGDDAAADGTLWVDPETAATLAMGVAWGTGLRLGTNQPLGPSRLALTFVPTRVLARQIVRRGRAWLSRSRKLAGLGD